MIPKASDFIAGGGNRPAPLALVGQVDADDPAVYEQISAPWEIIAKPLGHGRFRYHETYLITASLIITWETFDSCVRVQGLTPVGMLGLSIPIRVGPHSRYWNLPPSNNGLPATMPGGVDAVIDAGQMQVIVMINLSWLHQALPAQLVSRLEMAASSRFLPAPSQVVNRLGWWLFGVLEEARYRPDAFSHPLVVRSFEEELLQQLSDAVQLPPETPLPANGRVRHRGLQRALEFLRAVGTANVTVSQLCQAAGVSRRTLEYAFRDSLGLPPLKFLRLQRLHAARRELLAARPGGATVAGIAHRAGFLELGRFASEYKQLFGELPSQTLARPATRGTRPLLLRASA